MKKTRSKTLSVPGSKLNVGLNGNNSTDAE